MEINILICTILSVGAIFIGDFTIFQFPLALIFIPMTILTNIFFKFHGTKQSLKNCSFVSILLFSLSTISFFINKLFLYDAKNDASFLISIFLISIAPILGWSLINLENTRKVKNTLSKELSFIWAIFIAEIITYFFAGPNIFYRLANASLFFYLYSFFSTRESLLNFLTLQKLFFTIITFFLLIKTGSRGALFITFNFF